MVGRHSSGAQRRYPRSARVNEALREVLADALERIADSDERMEMVTVTAVDVDPSLTHAVVYLDSMTDSAAYALGQWRGRLQAAIAGELRLKRTPRLSFSVDPAITAGERVEEILRHIHGG